MADQSQSKPVPEAILVNLKRWENMANALRFAQVLLGAGGTGLALVVTSFTDELGTMAIKICSFGAALCIGVLSAFNVSGKADSVRRAWRHLTTALMRYQADVDIEVSALIKAYSEAEAMVGDVPFNQQGSASSSEKA